MSSKQIKGLKRNIIDKYYTKHSTAEEISSFIKVNLNPTNKDLIIEPSAGNGAFIGPIKNLSSNYIFMDIEPEHPEIKKQDYLDFNYKEIKGTYEKILAIGNPPFGRQSSLAIKFIKKSCLYCDSISFILPKSFKKDSMKKHFPINFHLILERDMDKNSFIVDDIPHDVPCVFQIWEKRNEPRKVPEKLEPSYYKFVKKEEKPDISFRRVGINAGEIDKNHESKSIQSHYFIKFENDIDDETLNKLKNISFGCKENTVAAKSISKQELIKEFNMII